MKKEICVSQDFLVRYITLFLVGISNSTIFYFLFSAITIYPVFFLLGIFFRVSLSSNLILSKNFLIEIIGPCVAGSAYFFLLILNLSTRGIKVLARIKLLLFTFGSLLVINILRIFFLSILYANNVPTFDFVHKFFWYFGSTIFVVGIWFLGVKIFKVKGIPFYSDIKYLLDNLRKKTKKTKRSKKN